MENRDTIEPKKTLIIIHGLNAQKDRYEKLIYSLSKDYTVHYFSYDWTNSIEVEVNKLIRFVSDNKIQSAHFLTHSFGSVIFKLFYERKNCTVERLVQLAPLNQGSILLRRIYSMGPLGYYLFGKGPKEFVDNQENILAMPHHAETGVIAGNKNFDSRSRLSYFIPWIMSIRESDGKIHIFETKFPGLQSFLTVYEYHSFLMMNDIAIEKMQKFFKEGRF